MTIRRLSLLLAAAVAMSLVLLVIATGCASPCGILPPGAEPEIEMEFWASEEVVPPGGCTMLHWEVPGAEDYPVFLSGEEVLPMGEKEVCLEEPTTFELVVGAPGGPHEAVVYVGVEGEPPPEEPPPGEPPPEEPPPQEPPPEEPPPEGGPEVIVFEAHPDTIPQGDCAVVFWEVHPPGEWPVIMGGQEVPPMGEREECPEATTTYELLVEAPGGPYVRTVTLHVEGAPGPEPPAPGPSPTSPPPGPSPTSPPPPPPASTPTPFVSRWGQCSWVGVEQAGINSHQPATWCSNGSFVTGLDLDRQAIDPLDSPVIGQAHCCPLAVGQFSNWGACSWVGVETAGINSHQAVAWCPDGSYLAGLDLDRKGAYDPLDSPVVGQARCCPLAAAQYSTWSSCSWVGVEQAGINSHQPVTWCPNGSFVVGFDLDRQAIDPLDSPVVGQALCCRP